MAAELFLARLDSGRNLAGEVLLDVSDLELGGLEELVGIDVRAGPLGIPQRALVTPFVEDGEAMDHRLLSGEEAEAGPLAVRSDEVGLDGIANRIGDPADERWRVDDGDLGEAALEHRTADSIETVDSLRSVAEHVLKKRREMASSISRDTMKVVGDHAERVDLHARKLLLRLREPESEDVGPLFRWK